MLLDFSILSLGKLLIKLCGLVLVVPGKFEYSHLTLCCKWQDISNQQPSRTMPECLFTSLLPIACVTSCQIFSLPRPSQVPSRCQVAHIVEVHRCSPQNGAAKAWHTMSGAEFQDASTSNPRGLKQLSIGEIN